MTLKTGSNPVLEPFWNIGTCRIPHFGTSSLDLLSGLARFITLSRPTRICGPTQDPPGPPSGPPWGSCQDPLWTPQKFDLVGREGRPLRPPPHEGQAFLPTSPLVDRPQGTDFASRPMVHHRPRADFQKPTLSRYFLYQNRVNN